ncbi:hypothetical protein [Prosthecobacter fluviatilis]|uniref:Quercetin 2,3-dioxygenase C-terminal cupin domain-containing protein n=1 Tax=Prosthecobacter fluviatilis TaxID=445931 RepID=A0ABW0KL65_9BACT
MSRLRTDADQRCLFYNDCVQAHLLGLDRRCPCFEACAKDETTVVITFGEAAAYLDGAQVRLRRGERLRVPASCPLRLVASEAADVLLLRCPASASAA